MAQNKTTSTDSEDTTQPIKDTGLLDWKPARYFLVWGLPIVTCLLAGAAIYVSRLGIVQDVHILAQDSWVPGEKAAVRVVAYESAGGIQTRFGVKLALASTDGQRVEELGASGTNGVPGVDIDFTVPDWPDGQYELRAHVETPLGNEDIATAIKLDRSQSDRDAQLFLPPPPPDRAVPAKTPANLAGTTIELLPHGSGLVPNLGNLLFLRTTNAEGAPVSTTVGLELVSGTLRQPLPETQRTDSLGLAVLSVHPQSNDITVRATLPELDSASETSSASDEPTDGDAGPGEADADADDDSDGDSDADEAPRSVDIIVPTTPAQLVLRLDSPTGLELEPFSVRVRSLHAYRPVHVDVYRGNRWRSARSGQIQRSKAQVSLSGLERGFALIQAYTASLAVGYGYSAHHLYIAPSQEREADSLRAIARELRRRNIDERYVNALLEGDLLRETRRVQLASAFLLSRLDRGYVRPGLLVSSQREQSAELETYQLTFRRNIAIAIGILGLLVAGLLAYAFTISAHRAAMQRKMFEADIGSDEDELYVTNMGRPVGLDRFRTILQIIVMVGVVAIGFLLIALLVSVMEWRG